MRVKLVQVRWRDYIESGPVDNLTHYFPVEKGPYNIQMVYNGTSSSLNTGVWAPHFGLSYVSHTVRSLMTSYCQCDLDVGKMFLNFLLHEELKRLSGVDVQHGRSTDPADAKWEKERGGPVGALVPKLDGSDRLALSVHPVDASPEDIGLRGPHLLRQPLPWGPRCAQSSRHPGLPARPTMGHEAQVGRAPCRGGIGLCGRWSSRGFLSGDLLGGSPAVGVSGGEV